MLTVLVVARGGLTGPTGPAGGAGSTFARSTRTNAVEEEAFGIAASTFSSCADRVVMRAGRLGGPPTCGRLWLEEEVGAWMIRGPGCCGSA